MEPAVTSSISSSLIFDESGKPVALIEVSGLDAAVADQVRALRGGVRETTQNLASVGLGIATTCRQIINSIQENLSDIKPNEFEIKFGVKLSTEGGLPLIAKAKGEATIEVRAVWCEKEVGRGS